MRAAARDPGQASDLTDGQTAFIASLRAAYDSWWRELSAEFERDARIVIGDERQPVTRLTCFEWHGSRRWGQADIKRGIFDNGLWALTVAQPGEYRVRLRRWPEEAGPDAAIRSTFEGGKAIPATRARLVVGSVDASREIEPGAASIDFDLRLQQGDVTMQSWLIGEGIGEADFAGAGVGAYYAYVQRTGP